MDKAKPNLAGLLTEKAGLKQNIYSTTLETFSLVCNEAEKVVKQLQSEVSEKDARIRLIFTRKSDFEFQIHVGGDVLVFLMHTNIFQLEPNNSHWASSYLKTDNHRSFCGLINIYNYLHDSLFYNRLSDIGYLIGRLLVNKEEHYFVQMKGKALPYHNDFLNTKLDAEHAHKLIEDLILLVLNFDMYLPPLNAVAQLTVDEMTQATQSQQFKTGKRLGFQFRMED